MEDVREAVFKVADSIQPRAMVRRKALSGIEQEMMSIGLNMEAGSMLSQ